MKNNNVVLFGADYELDFWKKAFRDYEMNVLSADLSPSCDIGLKCDNDKQDLFISGESQSVWNPAGCIWRIGAVNPPWMFDHFLNILSVIAEQVPMVNTADAHLLCSNRVKMLGALRKKSSLPLVNFQAFITGRYLIESSYKPKFPLILKIGNFEGGLMKWKIDSPEQWMDFFDSFRALNYPIIIEEYLEFDTEYRSLFIGDFMVLIKRKERKGWRVQHTLRSEIVDITEEVNEMTIKAKESIGLDIGALDFVEDPNGYKIIEVNDSPDINPSFLGLKENTWKLGAKILYNKIKGN